MLTVILILCLINTFAIGGLVGIMIYDNKKYDTVIEDEDGNVITDNTGVTWILNNLGN